MGVCAPGAVTSFMCHIRTSLPGGTVHFAGTETAIRWSGYVDGAVESGQRCAAEILQKSFDWKDRPAPSLMRNQPLGFSSLERNMPKFRTFLTAAVAITTIALAVVAHQFVNKKVE